MGERRKVRRKTLTNVQLYLNQSSEPDCRFKLGYFLKTKAREEYEERHRKRKELQRDVKRACDCLTASISTARSQMLYSYNSEVTIYLKLLL